MDNYNGFICFIISILLLLLTSLFFMGRTRGSVTLVNLFCRSTAAIGVKIKTYVTHSFRHFTTSDSTFSTEITVCKIFIVCRKDARKWFYNRSQAIPLCKQLSQLHDWFCGKKCAVFQIT